MRTIQIPIEPLEERYSIQWRRWFEDKWEGETAFIDTPPLTTKIEMGSFLDVYGTCYYKAAQMSKLVKMMHDTSFGQREDDWVLFHDLWSPDVLHLAYLRDGAGLKFRIAGCFHAGTWDEQDFLHQRGMQRWAKGLESSFLQAADLIFVATRFHKNLIESVEPCPCLSKKIRVTGFPIYPEDFVANRKPDKGDRYLIVFPHRKDPEKHPHLFRKLAVELGELADFVFTVDVVHTKKEYYELLNRADIAVSFALQETWGIAMQEALFSRCIPFVPNRLSYPELYKREFLYESYEELKENIRAFIHNLTYREMMLDEWILNAAYLSSEGADAIPRMKEEMMSYGC